LPIASVLTVSIYLVRHARAGKRREWHDEDSLRNLEPDGVRQAVAIASRLSERGPVALISSPFARCIETLEPLSLRSGLPITTDDRLAEGADPIACAQWIDDVADGTVLCSHGDVVTGVVEALVRRGMQVLGESTVAKGCVWTLERQSGGFSSARAWLAPRSD